MKKFWKDYWKLCKDTGDFYKEHWFGVIVLNVVVCAGTLAWYGRESIKEAIEDKFIKKGEEEEVE